MANDFDKKYLEEAAKLGCPVSPTFTFRNGSAFPTPDPSLTDDQYKAWKAERDSIEERLSEIKRALADGADNAVYDEALGAGLQEEYGTQVARLKTLDADIADLEKRLNALGDEDALSKFIAKTNKDLTEVFTHSYSAGDKAKDLQWLYDWRNKITTCQAWIGNMRTANDEFYKAFYVGTTEEWTEFTDWDGRANYRHNEGAQDGDQFNLNTLAVDVSVLATTLKPLADLLIDQLMPAIDRLPQGAKDWLRQNVTPVITWTENLYNLLTVDFDPRDPEHMARLRAIFGNWIGDKAQQLVDEANRWLQIDREAADLMEDAEDFIKASAKMVQAGCALWEGVGGMWNAAGGVWNAWSENKFELGSFLYAAVDLVKLVDLPVTSKVYEKLSGWSGIFWNKPAEWTEEQLQSSSCGRLGLLQAGTKIQAETQKRVASFGNRAGKDIGNLVGGASATLGWLGGRATELGAYVDANTDAKTKALVGQQRAMASEAIRVAQALGEHFLSPSDGITIIPARVQPAPETASLLGKNFLNSVRDLYSSTVQTVNAISDVNQAVEEGYNAWEQSMIDRTALYNSLHKPEAGAARKKLGEAQDRLLEFQRLKEQLEDKNQDRESTYTAVQNQLGAEKTSLENALNAEYIKTAAGLVPRIDPLTGTAATPIAEQTAANIATILSELKALGDTMTGMSDHLKALGFAAYSLAVATGDDKEAQETAMRRAMIAMMQSLGYQAFLYNYLSDEDFNRIVTAACVYYRRRNEAQGNPTQGDNPTPDDEGGDLSAKVDVAFHADFAKLVHGAEFRQRLQSDDGLTDLTVTACLKKITSVSGIKVAWSLEGTVSGTIGALGEVSFPIEGPVESGAEVIGTLHVTVSSEDIRKKGTVNARFSGAVKQPATIQVELASNTLELVEGATLSIGYQSDEDPDLENETHFLVDATLHKVNDTWWNLAGTCAGHVLTADPFTYNLVADLEHPEVGYPLGTVAVKLSGDLEAAGPVGAGFAWPVKVSGTTEDGKVFGDANGTPVSGGSEQDEGDTNGGTGSGTGTGDVVPEPVVPTITDPVAVQKQQEQNEINRENGYPVIPTSADELMRELVDSIYALGLPNSVFSQLWKNSADAIRQIVADLIAALGAGKVSVLAIVEEIKKRMPIVFLPDGWYENAQMKEALGNPFSNIRLPLDAEDLLLRMLVRTQADYDELCNVRWLSSRLQRIDFDLATDMVDKALTQGRHDGSRGSRTTWFAEGRLRTEWLPLLDEVLKYAAFQFGDPRPHYDWLQQLGHFDDDLPTPAGLTEEESLLADECYAWTGRHTLPLGDVFGKLHENAIKLGGPGGMEMICLALFMAIVYRIERKLQEELPIDEDLVQAGKILQWVTNGAELLGVIEALVEE